MEERIAAYQLDSMTNRMAKIQNLSKAFLPLVTRNDIGLYLNATDDEREHAVTRRTVGRQQQRSRTDDRMKIRLVGNYAMFHCLCKTRAQLPKWK